MANDEGMMRLAQILNATLELNAEIRKSAEAELLQLESQPGFGPMLIQLIGNEQMSSEIRISAAVAAKNFVKRSWSDTAESELSDEQQNLVRAAAFQTMFASTGNLQKQLSHSVYLIAKKDFPSKWPDLVNGLAVYLTGDDLERLVATLSTMDQLFKKYRFESKSTALWTELKMCLTAVQEPLTVLFGKMIEFIPQKDSMPAESAGQWMEVLLLIARVYHSLIFQDLPEYFEDHLTSWMNGFVQLLSLSVDTIQSVTGEPTSIDKLKAEICEIVTVYSQRYEEEIKPHMQGLIGAIWGLLVNTGQETRYDSMVCAALDFLTAICQRALYEDMFTGEGVLQTIAIDVAVKNLTLRAADMEMFEDEPLEYIKKDIEGTDSGTRRRGAIDLIRGLCRRFEAALVPLLSGAVSSYLSDGSNWMNKDIVYCVVTAMATKTETAKSGATSTSSLINIPDFYASTVREDLCSEDVNSAPVLKADAIKFIVVFRNQLPPDVLIEAIHGMTRLLSSNVTILHKYVAYGVERLLLVRSNGNPVFSSSNVPVSQLLSSFVNCFKVDNKAQNSAYLMKALMRVISIIDPSTAQAAGQIASELCKMVEDATKNPADPVHTHFLFETMCILIKKASSHCDGLDTQLLPLIEVVLSQDIADLIPYALQITGVLLTDCVTRGASTDAYFGFLPFLLRPELWSRSSNVPAALSVIECFLRAAPERVMKDQGEALMGQYVRLIASKNLDIYGFQLANALLPCIELANIDTPLAVLLNNMFKRVQTSKTPKFAKLFLVFIARFSIVRGAENLARAMEAIQSGLFRMVMERVVTVAMNEMSSMTTADEKRTIAIGFGNIIGDCTNQLSDAVGGLVVSTVAMTHTAPVMANFGQIQSLEDEQASMYNADGEFSNPFCKLTQASKEEKLAPQVANHRVFLAECVTRAVSNSPSLGSCISDEVKSILQSYAMQA